MTQMSKYWKEAWLDALRSGEYKQCRGALRKVKGKTESFCCLGVLTDLVIKDNSNCGEWRDNKNYFNSSIGLHTLDHLGLPSLVKSYVELSSDFYSPGNIYTDDGVIVLANKNDKGASFKQIADMIEKHIEGI